MSKGCEAAPYTKIAQALSPNSIGFGVFLKKQTSKVESEFFRGLQAYHGALDLRSVICEVYSSHILFVHIVTLLLQNASAWKCENGAADGPFKRGPSPRRPHVFRPGLHSIAKVHFV